MWNLTQQLLVEDFYKTTITEDISTLWDIDFTVAQAPQNTKWFIIINPNSTLNREKMFYHDVVWDRIYVRWVNRTDPKTHTSWDGIQINDSADIFNYISQNLQTTFNIEKTGSLAVQVWWWPIMKDNVEVAVADTDLTLTDGITNYICYDPDTNTITKQTSETDIVVAQITTAGWVITDIKYRNHKLNIQTPITFSVWSTTEWEVGTDAQVSNSGTSKDIVLDFVLPRWATWSIETAPSGSSAEITDNDIPPQDAVISTDNSSYILVTYSDWTYRKYNLDSIVTWDSTSIYTIEIKSPDWTFDANWITYSDWAFVDKVTWIYTFDWQIAYTNKTNIFTSSNTFNWDTTFAWQTTFKYHVNTAEDNWFDADEWTKQWFNFAWPAVTLNFTNLLDGWTYTFAITITGSATTLTLGTAGKKGWGSYTPLIIWATSIPELAVWTHMFVAEVFSAWIHVAYAWHSQTPA